MKIQKYSLITIAILLTYSLTTQALLKHLEMEVGRIVSYEVQKAEGAQHTLVLLPGINRSLEAQLEKKFFSEFKKYKLNLVTITTSSHPRSIQALDPDQTPYFQTHTMTLSDYADEVEFVIQKLKLGKVFIASLSYSSAILAQIKSSNIAGLIEMVPMGDPLEGADKMTKSARDFQEALKLNPFGGAAMVRYQRDSAYQSNWKTTVTQRLNSDSNSYGPNPRVDDIIQGYVSLARAAEDYRLINVSTKIPRHFILVSQEQEERLTLQISAVQKEFKKQKSQVGFLLVANSGHILPSENPQSAAYALATMIDMIIQKDFKSGTIVQDTFTELTDEQKKEIGIQ